MGSILIPAASASASIDVQEFTSSGTWTKPANAKSVTFFLVSGSGGGGSGRMGAAGTGRGGGGGGEGGMAYLAQDLSADVFASSESVTIGAGGAGGAGVTTNDTDGNAGGAGGNSIFAKVTLNGMAGGAGGNAGVANGGATYSTFYYTADNNSGTTVAGGSGQTTQPFPFSDLSNFVSPCAGNGGGGVDGADLHSAGGVGQVHDQTSFASGADFSSLAATAGAAGGGDGGAVSDSYYLSMGGAGGGGNNAGSGGNGSSPTYGSGGGGGGGCLNGNTSGAGGDGGDGYCIVITTLGA